MQTFPAGAVGFSGVPVQPGFVFVVVGCVWPPGFCQPATLTKTSSSDRPTGAGIGNVMSTPKRRTRANALPYEADRGVSAGHRACYSMLLRPHAGQPQRGLGAGSSQG